MRDERGQPAGDSFGLAVQNGTRAQMHGKENCSLRQKAPAFNGVAFSIQHSAVSGGAGFRETTSLATQLGIEKRGVNLLDAECWMLNAECPHHPL
jgi:hypothetical protein